MKISVTLETSVGLKAMTAPATAGVLPARCQVLSTALGSHAPALEVSSTLVTTTALITAATLVASPASIESATAWVKPTTATVTIHVDRLSAPPHDRVSCFDVSPGET
jgi:hypothetical protein